MTEQAKAGPPGEGVRPPVQHAHRVLELARVLEAVGARATSPAGRALVEGLTPTKDVAEARARLARVEAVRGLADRSDYTGVPAVPDADRALDTLRVQGSVLTAPALYRTLVLLRSAEALRGALKDPPEPLQSLFERLFADRASSKVLADTVDAEGEVLDRASPTLGRLRREIHTMSAALVRALEKYAQKLPATHRVEDASVTVRGGRYVVAIRREGRSAVGGIVHDESASGATLFVEPPDQVERMNRLRHLEGEAQREVTRILRERTELLRPQSEPLRASLGALVEFDALVACARSADAWSAHTPELVDAGAEGLQIVSGRHPLLMERGIETVPFDLSLDRTERVMVVSGPNTGGKTVLLKALGLIPTLAQCGIVPPVGKGSCLPVFDAVFADIGDEQSIQDDLSTFSGHIANVASILAEATASSLVLLDELGTGTDPSEGAALARAVLEALEVRGTLTVATSHLGALKRIAEESDAVVNASLQFDSERMEPTYRLVKGRPGRSFGIQIARRLSLPEALVERALELLDDSELRADGLLARLEQDEKKTRELLDGLEVERAQAQAILEEVAGREAELRARERTSEQRAREEARQLLLDARAEVEQALVDARQAAGSDEAERAARRAVEQAAQRVAPGDSSSPHEAASSPAGAGPDLDVGSRVRMRNGAAGVIAEIGSGRVTVDLDGGVRLQMAPDQLEVVQGEGARQNRGRTHWEAPSTGALHEVDLRGLRVDEVEASLASAVDQAVLSDLPSLRIIHGMGTGAVRARVGELVGEDPRVDEVRAGERGEGGAGVTVVTFR